MRWVNSRQRSLVGAALLTLSAACGEIDGPTTPPVTVTRVDITPATATLAPTQTVQLSAIARGADGAVISGRTIAWTSTATSIATVSGSGLVTAVATGTATITASTGGVNGTVAIAVVSANGTIATVTVALTDQSAELGQLSLATATARDAQGAPVALGSRPLTWSSSNVSVAKVNSLGVITSVGVGTANITATVNDNGTPRVGSAAFTVTAIAGAPLSADVNMPGLTFSPLNVVIKLGGVVRFIFPNDDHNVIWDSGQTGVPADIQATRNVTISRLFSVSGVFTYQCTLHPGMQGTVIVSP